MMFMEERGRIYAADETGAVTAEILFNDEGEDAVCVVRTYVAESLRGQGIAGKLMEAASEAAKKRGEKGRRGVLLCRSLAAKASRI